MKKMISIDKVNRLCIVLLATDFLFCTDFQYELLKFWIFDSLFFIFEGHYTAEAICKNRNNYMLVKLTNSPVIQVLKILTLSQKIKNISLENCIFFSGWIFLKRILAFDFAVVLDWVFSTLNVSLRNWNFGVK